MTEQEMIAELKRLREENEKLKARKEGTVSLKVTEKGGVSVYGLGRFPVTLYLSQWEKLLGSFTLIRDFLTEHRAELSVKE